MIQNTVTLLIWLSGLLPKGEKRPIVEKFTDVGGDFSASQGEDEGKEILIID